MKTPAHNSQWSEWRRADAFRDFVCLGPPPSLTFSVGRLITREWFCHGPELGEDRKWWTIDPQAGEPLGVGDAVPCLGESPIEEVEMAASNGAITAVFPFRTPRARRA
jgi:hypothetical protein